MAWCGLILKQVENSIVNKNKHFEDLRNKNKALQAQVDDLNKAYASVLSNLSMASKEKKSLEATLSNQEASIQTLTASLALAREEIQKKEEEIAALRETCIDKFAEGANQMKTVFFQDFKEGRHLGWNVDQFLAEHEEAQKLAGEDDNSNSDDFGATATEA